MTCHNRAYEVSKCAFALTTRSNISKSKILYCGKYRISDLLRDFCMTFSYLNIIEAISITYQHDSG